MQNLIEESKIRKDLYYRLCTHRLVVPPLRERTEDIGPLLDYFLTEAARSLKKKKPTIPPELVTLLGTYGFPGNIRELESMVHDAVTRHHSGILSMESFRYAIDSAGGLRTARKGGSEIAALEKYIGPFPTFSDVESLLIREAMKRAKGNQGIAANLLRITRQTLHKRLLQK